MTIENNSIENNSIKNNTLTKDKLRKIFNNEWKKHYDIDILREYGFTRRQCKVCGRFFWSVDDRDTCGDPSCVGYRFIGNPIGNKHDYTSSWKTIEHYFTAHGHKSIHTYPCVARWRKDLFFTIASISDFQPYVVRGEVEPPGNPLIIPQTCIRFGDISNVGVTGRHLTDFVMVGQHAFNTKKTGLFYWKNDALGHDIEMLKQFGIPLSDITFKEDVWMGGGNFGPSMEYFVGGLELGNCVFMQYQILPNGEHKELDTKVIDMGAGLERFAWLTNGTPTIYDTTFGPVVKDMFKQAGIDYDAELANRFWSHAGGLDVEEAGANLNNEKKRIADELGMSWDELLNMIQPYQAVYAVADHLKTILLAITDGQLPSNSGGGYNLRMILRRSFGFNDKLGLNLDFDRIIRGHAKFIKPLFPHYSDGVDTTINVINDEYNKYNNTKNKTKGRVSAFISKVKKIGKLDVNQLTVLYASYGIPPELIADEADEQGIKIEIPDNFYDMVRSKEEIEEESNKWIFTEDLPDTIPGFYEDLFEMDATVIDVKDSYIILDKTCFYPEGGGQVGDTGYINDVRIIDTIKHNNVVLHKVSDEMKDKIKKMFKRGQTVHIKIDKMRRIQISQHHTGVHLINACARQILGRHIWQAGAYKDEHKGQIDLTHYKRITDRELESIESLANDYIRQELKVVTEEMDRTEAEQKFGMRIYQGGAVPGKRLRIVSIDNIDHEACGGTHHNIDNLGRLGMLKIVKRENVKDGIERLIFKCGREAIDYIQARERMVRDISKQLSVPEDQLKETVSRFFDEWKDRGKLIERLEEQIAEVKLDRIKNEYEKTHEPVEMITDVSKEILIKIGQLLSKTDSDVEAVLINKQKDIVCATGKKSNTDAGELLKRAIKNHGGKGSGGGRGHIAFGKLGPMTQETK